MTTLFHSPVCMCVCGHARVCLTCFSVLFFLPSWQAVSLSSASTHSPVLTFTGPPGKLAFESQWNFLSFLSLFPRNALFETFNYKWQKGDF